MLDNGSHHNRYIKDYSRISFIYQELAVYQISLEKDNNSLTIEKCLGDTINTCLLIVSEGKYGDKKNYGLLLSGLDSFNDYKFNGKLTDVDLKKYAFTLLIISSKLFLLLNKNVRRISKVDYLVSRSIKEKELRYFASEEDINEFFMNCLLDIKL